MIEQSIEALLDRRRAYVSGSEGPTKFGITQAVARAHGFMAPMPSLPREEAAMIYRRLYWLRPRFDELAKRNEKIAIELFDMGLELGPAVAVTFLQRALTALSRNGQDYPDLVPDGRVNEPTLFALDTFIEKRGSGTAESVMLRALEALAGERYLRLAERRPANTELLDGWLAARAES